MSCRDGREYYVDRCYKPCKDGHIRNGTTRRCRKIRFPKVNSRGECVDPTKKFFIDKCYNKCKPGKKRNRITRRCRNKVKLDSPSTPNSTLSSKFLTPISGPISSPLNYDLFVTPPSQKNRK